MQASIRPFVIRIGAAVLAIGCASTTTTRPAAPPPVWKNDSAVVAKPATTTWSPHRTPGTWHYEARTNAVITHAGDTSTAPIPVQSTTRYTITLDTASQGFALSGSVDSVAVTTAGKIPPPQGMKAPYAQFTGKLSLSGKLDTLQTTAQPTCGGNGIDPFIAGVHGLFIAFPPMLTNETSWEDTVSTVTCRGEVPITTTTVRSYRVIGQTVWQGVPALEIARSGTITVGSQSTLMNGAMATVTGNGTSTATLHVDPSTGMLLGATGESHITITITAQGSSLPFRQDVADTVTLQH